MKNLHCFNEIRILVGGQSLVLLTTQNKPIGVFTFSFIEIPSINIIDFDNHKSCPIRYLRPFSPAENGYSYCIEEWGLTSC